MKALVVVLRGLPAGAIGPYGNRWIETPTLGALAARGVVYDWHFAAQPHLGGRYDFAAGPGLDEVLHAAGAPVVRAGLDTAAEALAARAGEGRWLLWVEHDLRPPWDIAEEILEAYFASPPEADDEEEEEDSLEPLLDPPAGPLDPADDALFRRLQTTFAAAVTQADLALEAVLEAAGEDVLVVVTSDWGQALGEHGAVGAAPLHEEVVHVPLILAGPGCPAGRRVEALTASVDLAATLAAYFGVALSDMHGHDLRPGAPPPAREHVCVGDGDEWGVRTAVWYLRLPRGGEPPRLYVKPDDRCEVNDVAQHHPDLAESLERTLRAFVGGH